MLLLRRQLATLLLDRAATADGRSRTDAWFEALQTTWLLTENVLTAFELFAEPDDLDVRKASERSRAWSKFKDRKAKKRNKFVRKAWGYHILNGPMSDELCAEHGLDPERGRAALAALLRRSADYLELVLQRLQSFSSKYSDLCNSYKHGRALFGFTLSVGPKDSPASDRLHFRRDDAVLTSVTSEGSGLRITELRVDQDFCDEVRDVLKTLAELLHRMASRTFETAEVMPWLIAQHEKQDFEVTRNVTLFYCLVDPETEDERRLLT